MENYKILFVVIFFFQQIFQYFSIVVPSNKAVLGPFIISPSYNLP